MQVSKLIINGQRIGLDIDNCNLNDNKCNLTLYDDKNIYDNETSFLHDDDEDVFVNLVSGLILSEKDDELFLNSTNEYKISIKDLEKLGISNINNKMNTLIDVTSFQSFESKDSIYRKILNDDVDNVIYEFKKSNLPLLVFEKIMPRIAVLTMGSSGSGKTYNIDNILHSKTFRKDIEYEGNFVIMDLDNFVRNTQYFKNVSYPLFDSKAGNRIYDHIKIKYDKLLDEILDKGIPVIIETCLPDDEIIEKLVNNSYIIYIMRVIEDINVSDKRRFDKIIKTRLYKYRDHNIKISLDDMEMRLNQIKDKYGKIIFDVYDFKSEL
jgi:hypothetical protein